MAERLLAEFRTQEGLAEAIRWFRESGYRGMRAYTPFPSEEVIEALGYRRSRLPFVVFAVGIAAAGGAFFLQWFLVDFLYPLNAGGRPAYFPLAYILITFEMGILFAGLTAFFGVLALGRLFRLVDVPQSTDGFGTASRDRFWLEVSRSDDWERTATELEERGALRVETPRYTP